MYKEKQERLEVKAAEYKQRGQDLVPLDSPSSPTLKSPKLSSFCPDSRLCVESPLFRDPTAEEEKAAQERVRQAQLYHKGLKAKETLTGQELQSPLFLSHRKC